MKIPMQDVTLSIVIPCYNEKASIRTIVDKVREAPVAHKEIIIVDDCSTDGSEQVLRENGFNYLSLPINLGIGGGVQSGYRYAQANGYDIAIQMDGDGQHDPAYLHRVIEPVAKGELDMCIGSRFLEKEGFQTSFMRRLGIRIESALIRIRVGEAPVLMRERQGGTSSIVGFKPIYFMIKVSLSLIVDRLAFSRKGGACK